MIFEFLVAKYLTPWRSTTKKKNKDLKKDMLNGGRGEQLRSVLNCLGYTIYFT